MPYLRYPTYVPRAKKKRKSKQTKTWKQNPLKSFSFFDTCSSFLFRSAFSWIKSKLGCRPMIHQQCNLIKFDSPWASHLYSSSLSFTGILAMRIKWSNAYKMLSTPSLVCGRIVTICLPQSWIRSGEEMWFGTETTGKAINQYRFNYNIWASVPLAEMRARTVEPKRSNSHYFTSWVTSGSHLTFSSCRSSSVKWE